MNFTKVRGFELLTTESNKELLPKRETRNAAGYDLRANQDTIIKPGEIALVGTGVKAYMLPNELLYLFDRSSNARKKGVVLINSVGVIDSDYYNNDSNEGHIMAQMKNITNETVVIPANERFVQAVFMSFKVADNDEATGVRAGGFGSTN